MIEFRQLNSSSTVSDMKRIALFPLLALCVHLSDSPTSAAESTNAKPAIISVADIVYGRLLGAGLLTDMAFPKTTNQVPAILSVHGGRWRSGHKRDSSAIKVDQWAELGFFAMSIDYRLVDCTPAPACYQDLQCAIRFIHANAMDFNIDTNRIYLIGQSAGGHLVSLAATLGDGPWKRTGGWEKSTNAFRAAISVAACYELPSLSWGNIWSPDGQNLLESRRLASPIYHVRRDMKPLMILHADNDQSVPIANALLMVDALKKAEADFVFHRYADAGHMGITQEVIDRTLEFIRRVEAEGR